MRATQFTRIILTQANMERCKRKNHQFQPKTDYEIKVCCYKRALIALKENIITCERHYMDFLSFDFQPNQRCY